MANTEHRPNLTQFRCKSPDARRLDWGVLPLRGRRRQWLQRTPRSSRSPANGGSDGLRRCLASTVRSTQGSVCWKRCKLRCGRPWPGNPIEIVHRLRAGLNANPLLYEAQRVPAHLRIQGCELVREGRRHSWWGKLSSGRRSAVPRRSEIDDRLASSICNDLGIPQFKRKRAPRSKVIHTAVR